MKILFSFFVILLMLKVSAQMPEGYFNNANEYGDGEEFYFGKNNSFVYLWNCSDCGRKSGAGIYALRKDTLELHFGSSCKIDTLKMMNDRLSAPENRNDSIFHLVSVIGESELTFLHVQLSDNKGTNLISLTKRQDGYYYFGIKASDEKLIYLHITSPGFNEEWVALTNLQMPAQITLTAGDYRIPPWTIYSYKVPYIGKNKFELRPLNATPSAGTKLFRGKIN